LKTRTIDLYEDQINRTVMRSVKNGVHNYAWMPVTMCMASPIPPRSAAMLKTLAAISRTHADQSTQAG
jgi:hypothetical protein